MIQALLTLVLTHGIVGAVYGPRVGAAARSDLAGAWVVDPADAAAEWRMFEFTFTSRPSPWLMDVKGVAFSAQSELRKGGTLTSYGVWCPDPGRPGWFRYYHPISANVYRQVGEINLSGADRDRATFSIGGQMHVLVRKKKKAN